MLSVAIAFHEIDEDKIKRQTEEWLADVGMMMEAQSPVKSGPLSGLVLPDGMQVKPG